MRRTYAKTIIRAVNILLTIAGLSLAILAMPIRKEEKLAVFRLTAGSLTAAIAVVALIFAAASINSWLEKKLKD